MIYLHHHLSSLKIYTWKHKHQRSLTCKIPAFPGKFNETEEEMMALGGTPGGTGGLLYSE